MEESTLDNFHTCKRADRADGGVKAGEREIIRKLVGKLAS
jgi:hypothetical protein